MKFITIKNQAEYDALPDSFADYTIIRVEGESAISASRAWESAHVEARGSAHVVAWESAHVEAWESAHVEARGSAHVVAWESAHVEARGSAHVVAWGSAHVEAWESAHVEAWGSAHVVAWESAHVVAWESAHVEARGSAHVEARESAHVEAWGSAHVEARGSAHVVAWESVSVRVFSGISIILLFGFSIAIVAKTLKHKIIKKDETSYIQIVDDFDWFGNNAIEKKKFVTLFKRVSKDFLTQEGEPWETKWKIGSILEHPAWSPEIKECGSGKFHACSRPYFGDEFRSKTGDRYIAIRIYHKDLYPWPNPQYPHKIGFRKGKVLYECDSYGNKIKS